MALTGKKVQRDGWQHQADCLALTYTAVGTTAVTAIGQALRQPSLQAGPRHPRKRTLELETSKTAELDRQGARETAAEWICNARRETLVARAARLADEKIAKLESDLGAAREQIAQLENEKHSLQSSVDLTVSENSRLSHRVRESDDARNRASSQLEQMKTALTSIEAERNWLAAAANESRCKLEHMAGALATTEAERVKLSFAVDEACSKLEQMKAALATAKAERITLSFAVDEVNEKRRTETNTLNTQLRAMSERAVTAERRLTEARQKLLARAAENCSLERRFVNATSAQDAAYKELEPLKKALQIKERQFQDLDQSRSELIEITITLLRAFKKRRSALADAEQRIKMLAELFAQLEVNKARRREHRSL